MIFNFCFNIITVIKKNIFMYYDKIIKKKIFVYISHEKTKSQNMTNGRFF